MQKVILHLSDLHYDKKYVKDLSIVLSALKRILKNKQKNRLYFIQW